MFKVFVRNWWQYNPSWPDGLEPHGGARKHTLAKNIKSEETAQRFCRDYNATHKPGRLSRKAEYEEQ